MAYVLILLAILGIGSMYATPLNRVPRQAKSHSSHRKSGGPSGVPISASAETSSHQSAGETTIIHQYVPVGNAHTPDQYQQKPQQQGQGNNGFQMAYPVPVPIMIPFPQPCPGDQQIHQQFPGLIGPIPVNGQNGFNALNVNGIPILGASGFPIGVVNGLPVNGGINGLPFNGVNGLPVNGFNGLPVNGGLPFGGTGFTDINAILGANSGFNGQGPVIGTLPLPADNVNNGFPLPPLLSGETPRLGYQRAAEDSSADR